MIFSPCKEEDRRSRAQRGAVHRRRYVILCLALSALARSDAQTTLGSLADDVLMAAAEPTWRRPGSRSP
jgi:hypothetical protein